MARLNNSFLIFLLACVLLVDAVPLGLKRPTTKSSPVKAPPIKAPPVKATPIVAKTTAKAATTALPTLVKTTSAAVTRISTTAAAAKTTSAVFSNKSATSSTSIVTTSVGRTSATSAITRSSAVSSSSAVSASSLASSSTASSALTSASATPSNGTAAACPIKATNSTKTAKKTARDDLFRRVGTPEFIGWHGTNSITADFWVSQGGTISKPPAPKAGIFDSFTFDFFGQTNKQADLTSGADQALGVGLYVADQRAFAESFANVNVQVNKAKDATFAGTAKVCAIFAKDSANWRTAITKAFIPTNLIGDSADATKKAALENKRLAQIKGALALAGRSVQNAANVVKFGVLFPGATGVAGTVNQLVLPSAITTLFSATCFDPAAAAASGQGDLDYSSVAQRTEWCIVSETGTDPCAQPAQCG